MRAATGTGAATGMGAGPGRRRRRGRRRGRGGDGDGVDRSGRAGGASMGKQRKKQRENDIFVSVVYIEGTFSTGWSHQPVLKVCFGQAKRREATPFSTGWWHKPVLKAPPLVPVCATTRY